MASATAATSGSKQLSTGAKDSAIRATPMASTAGRWSGERSPLRWFETWMCRRHRKGMGMM